MRRFLTAVLITGFVMLPLPSANAETPTSWSVQAITMESGRKFFALLPNCGAPCVTPRQLVIFSHGAGAPEDVLNAGKTLKALRSYSPETVFAYSVSKGGTKKFDAGVDYCCTFVDTQEVEYLADVASRVAATTPISVVKLMGFSNGGMLSERAICWRPDLFHAAASWAGTWRTWAEGCTRGVVNMHQWHGTADTVVPIEGGTVYRFGRYITIPPATEMASKILPESSYLLTVIQGEDHTASGATTREMTQWVVAQP